MISQVNGLAQQLSTRIFNIKTDLIFPWSMLQPGFLPVYRWIFKNKIDFNNKPHIVISCGRKSVYFSLYLKKLFLKKIITIHIQNPKINFSKFDFVISPNHDKIKGTNVIKSIGAIHQFTKKMIESKKYSYPSVPKNNLISFIIGGNNRHYKFTKESILDLINKIKHLKKRYSKFNFLVISSRRTGLDIIRFMKEKLDKIAHIWNGVGENPYIAVLLILWVSGIASGFLDNIPFTITMIPIVQIMLESHPIPHNLLWWSLALGACLGGNITMIGASANIVGVGISKKYGVDISFIEFMKTGVVVSFISLCIASLYLVTYLWIVL